jgi:transaldolase
MSIKLPKIFLDSGDPEETKKAKGLLGYLDGQTTNPSLVVKNPDIQKFLASGKKLTEEALLGEYKRIIEALHKELAGPISVEVYADWNTKAADMLKQAENMFTWGRNVYIKFPTIPEGVKAAHEFVQKGGRVNMTLVFDETQAAAVYAATEKTTQPAFISPFIGRWDDRGYNGLDLVKNILKLYKKFDKIKKAKKSHVLVLAASIRHLDHLYASIFLKADIATVPLKLIQEWVHEETWIPDEHYRVKEDGLKSLIYEDLQLKKNFEEYVIEKKDGDLLDEGLNKFVKDWKALIQM